MFDEEHEKELYEILSANGAVVNKTFFHNKKTVENVNLKEVYIYLKVSKKCPFDELLDHIGTYEWVKAIENAISFMQKNYKKKITLQDTANAAGMEVESFRKFFKKTIRMSFTDYLLELRLVVACKLN